MINKQSLWFVTLFSMILVLSIYYVTMKEDSFTSVKSFNANDSEQVNVTESSALVALRVKDDEEMLKEMQSLQATLLNDKATLEEKNKAYESLQIINENKGKESEIEEIILKEFNLDSFVKINNDRINITIDSSEHDAKLANKIMNSIQRLYNNKMYITVRFQK
ncbi:MAG: SpoIIIAH-like family protein [Firmicutes bacterium]|nr:SpoIIIAH-like family protein [Bacillota bacterium]